MDALNKSDDSDGESMPLLFSKRLPQKRGRTRSPGSPPRKGQGQPRDTRRPETGTLRDADYQRKFRRSVGLSLNMFSAGIVTSLLGPIFLDLKLITHTTVGQASTFLSAASAGDIVGSMLCGCIYDHYSQNGSLVAVPVLMGVIVALLPYCVHYWLMVAACFLLYSCRMGLITVCDADILRVWGLEVDPFMQAIHLALSFGAVTTPLILGPFLASRNRANHSAPQHNHTRHRGGPGPSADFDLVADLDLGTSLDFGADLDPVANRDLGNVTDAIPFDTVLPELPETHVQVACFICCALCLLLTVPLGVEIVRGRFRRTSAASSSKADFGDEKNATNTNFRVGKKANSTSNVDDNNAKGGVHDGQAGLGDAEVPRQTVGGSLEKRREGLTRETTSERNRSPGRDDVEKEVVLPPQSAGSQESVGAICYESLPFLPYLALILWICVMIMLVDGAQFVANAWLAPFAVFQMRWRKSQGALLTSVLWISTSVARIVLTWLSRFIKAVDILGLSFLGMIPSLVGIVVAARCRVDWAMWVSTAVFGAFLAPVFASSLSWVNAHVVTLNGKASSCLLASINIGVLIANAVSV